MTTEFKDLALLTRMVAIAGKSKIHEGDLSFLPENYKTLYLAKEAGCSEYAHHAISVVNQQDKEIIIASYGTHLNPYDLNTTFNDIYADIQLTMHNIPTKFESLERFINLNLESLDRPEEYKIIFAGHSLGGFMSQLGGTLCKAKGFENVKVIAFDSPGAKEVAEKVAQLHFYEGDIHAGVENYITKPNLVNLTNSHLGDIYYAPNVKQVPEGERGWLKWISEILGLKRLIEGVNDHMLWNFTEFFELNEGAPPEEHLLKISVGSENMIFIENGDNLASVKKHNPDYIKFERHQNVSQPEYISLTLEECGWCNITLYDHDDICNYLTYNYDNYITSMYTTMFT